jgi:hypothetical protein
MGLTEDLQMNWTAESSPSREQMIERVMTAGPVNYTFSYSTNESG